MMNSEFSVALLLVLGLTNAKAIEQLWTWEPVESLDLSTMEPAFESKDVKLYICRVKNGDDIFVGSYQHPPPPSDPQNKCCMLDSSYEPLNEADKSKIEIMKYPHDKVKWVSVNSASGTRDEVVDKVRPQIIPAGKEGEDKFVCRFRIPAISQEPYIGRGESTGRMVGCGAGEHITVPARAVAFHYEILTTN